VLDCGALAAFPRLLEAKEESLRKEACWTLSNVAAGTPAQQQQLVAAGMLAPLARRLADPAETARVREEAAWVFAGLGQAAHLQLAADAGCIGPLCRLAAQGVEPAETVVAAMLQPMTIPAGLTLTKFLTPNEYGCDGCGRAVPEGMPMFGDRDADYDLCEPCFAEATRLEGGMPGSEELSRLVAEAGGPEALLAMPERAGALLGRYFSIAGMAAKIVSRALSLAQQNEVGRDD
jgi:hypothetical protein